MIFEKAGYNQITTLAQEKKMSAKQIADHSGTIPEMVELIMKTHASELDVSAKLLALQPLAFQIIAKKLIEEHDIHAAAFVLGATLRK